MHATSTDPDISCANSQDIAPPSGHYSHACTAAGMVFISGQLPLDEQGRSLADAPFEVQAGRVLQNIDACLKAVGARRSDLVQVRVYVTSMGKWPAFNQIYADWIGNHKPARAVAHSPSLHHGVAVEVEAVALHRPPRRNTF
ncbi:MAG: RidA family protein [Proteobacteria bacterium]|nr:RidA family protein [Pseudomonadota bacterium]